jgi:hypothetical protein
LYSLIIFICKLVLINNFVFSFFKLKKVSLIQNWFRLSISWHFIMLSFEISDLHLIIMSFECFEFAQSNLISFLCQNKENHRYIDLEMLFSYFKLSELNDVFLQVEWVYSLFLRALNQAVIFFLQTFFILTNISLLLLSPDCGAFGLVLIQSFNPLWCSNWNLL